MEISAEPPPFFVDIDPIPTWPALRWDVASAQDVVEWPALGGMASRALIEHDRTNGDIWGFYITIIYIYNKARDISPYRYIE